MPKVIYCGCGLLIVDGKCPHCGEDYPTFEEYQERKRRKIGKWSGKSNSKNAFNDYK